MTGLVMMSQTRRVLRRAGLQHDFAGVIALGQDAHEHAVRDDEQGADGVFGHQADGVVDGGVRSDGDDLAVLPAENGADGVWQHDHLRLGLREARIIYNPQQVFPTQ